MARVRGQDIERLLARGKTLHSEHLWGRYLPSESQHLIVIRIGRHQAPSHKRNRFRRRVRGHFQNRQLDQAPHQWLVGLKGGVKEGALTRQQLTQEIDQMTAQALQ